MKFKTRILLLPIGTAAVFVTGLLVAFFVSDRTADALNKFSAVDEPYVRAIERIDRQVEEFRLTLQSAATEGDEARLEDVKPMAQKTMQSLAAAAGIEGKQEIGGRLQSAFNTYQSAAIEATRILLRKGDGTEPLKAMQAAQKQLAGLLEEQKGAAALSAQAQQQVALQGIRTSLWVNLATGLAVLAALGSASWFIVRSVWRDLGDEPDRLRKIAQQVADGDLAMDQAMVTDDGSLAAAIARMVRGLRATVGTIRASTDSIATAVAEIATGNHDLSQRTEIAASNLQQTASSLQQLTVTVQHSASSAQAADGVAQGAAAAARRGGEIVQQVMQSMEGIDDASRKIQEIISVIDGIAFQTNILALNAAVEAARAGEQGRGFAVVASEVRSLAQRSATAAREIKGLITASGERVESGSRLVKDAGAAMDDILKGVQQLATTLVEVSSAAREQSSDLNSMNEAVGQLDRMIQQNAALVEESAAAASSLNDQAGVLASAVASFRLGQAAEAAGERAETHA